MKNRQDKYHRRSIRLKGYDYTQAGAYFVTLCTHGRECFFNDTMLRSVIETIWLDLPHHFPHVILDEWVLMPNHLHGILVLGEVFPVPPLTNEGPRVKGEDEDCQSILRNAGPLPRLASGSLGAVIGNFKSVTARRINTIRKVVGAPVWQRNYYEHIIRDDIDLNRIREYIVNNPLNWQSDEDNPLNFERNRIDV